jgi:hypothetical protein|tara:strand:+ start:9299 stop:9439 length:141 start_codon:yes stop_codon:yes gene_type:complete
MIIIELLQLDEYLGGGKYIDFAKGKFKLTTSLKDALKQYKRKTHGN